MNRRTRTALLVSLVVASACGTRARTSTGRLPEGTVATVGADRIDDETVKRISAAQGVRAAVAGDRAVFDALFAAFAKEHFGQPLERQVERSVAARALLEDFARQAREQGPATDDEVALATERRFWELDRPPLLRTIHAVVIVKTPQDEPRARALAERIRSAVAAAKDAASFRAAALGVPPEGLDVRVEDLDPVARDGRTLDPEKPPSQGSGPGHYAADYVEAAYAIPDVGMKSPVVKTEFGYHVIFALGRIPEQRIPLEERRRIVTPDVLATRAQKLRDEALAKARESTPIDVERAAMELTQRVGGNQ